MIRNLIVRLLVKIAGFNFISRQGGVIFLARDERSLNCAVRDYVEMLDQ